MPGKRNEDKDERVKLPLDPETALRALLAVDPQDEAAADTTQEHDANEEGRAGHAGQRQRGVW